MHLIHYLLGKQLSNEISENKNYSRYREKKHLNNNFDKLPVNQSYIVHHCMVFICILRQPSIKDTLSWDLRTTY